MTDDVDLLVVGAGFAGLSILHEARSRGLRCLLLERADGVGGTWYWNRYPGARCDVESIDYSFSYEPVQSEWTWSERYAPQPEILRYAEFVVDRLGLRDDIRLNTSVRSVTFDDASSRWTVTTDDGDTYTARFCAMATGNLSEPNLPPIPGLDTFRGRWYQTGRWPAEGVDLSGQRVAVIGTGSTGIQIIPQLAKVADELIVFQRTPNFSWPARNRVIPPDAWDEIRADYPRRRQANRQSKSGLPYPAATQAVLEVPLDEAHARYDAAWERGGSPSLTTAFNDMFVDIKGNAVAADYVRSKIAEIVSDEETARRLSPFDHPIGSKRLCVDIDYFETYNRANVSLVDISGHSIDEIVENGIRVGEAIHEVDVIVFATGFDAVSGALLSMDVRGRGGRRLGDHWAEGARAYAGVAVAGFPNLFLPCGPGSPAALSNVMVVIEAHAAWIAETVSTLVGRGVPSIEAREEAESAWVEQVQAIAAQTIYPLAKSWYMGANIEGKPRVFTAYAGGVGPYLDELERIARDGYEGFDLTGGRQGSVGGIAFQDRGAGSAIVFVHGWGCSTDVFAPQVDAFTGSHRVIGVDLRGHGASHVPDPSSTSYSVEAFADDVAAVIHALGLPADITVVGHSLGGAVAVEVARRQKVGAAVLIDPAIRLDGSSNESPVRAVAENVRHDVDGSWRRDYATRLLGGVPEPAATALIERFASLPADVSHATISAIVDYDAAGAIREVDVPITWIAATGRAPDAEQSAGLRVFEAERAGHFVHLEAPEWTNAVILGALA